MEKEKKEYMQMPEKFRKHGDMPTQYEMQDDIDAYKQWRMKGSGVLGNDV